MPPAPSRNASGSHRRRPQRTRAAASRAIRAQRGSAWSTSARATWSSRAAQRPDAQVPWRTPRPSRSRSPRRVPATGRESKEPRRTVGAIAIVKRSDCRGKLSTRPIVGTSHPPVNPPPSLMARRWVFCTPATTSAVGSDRLMRIIRTCSYVASSVPLQTEDGAYC